MKDLFLKIPEEKRQRIYEKTILQFAKYGYESTTTSSIAKSVNISVGSLFQYFDNKEDIYISVAKYYALLTKQNFDEIMEHDETFIIKVEKIIKRIFKNSRENPEYIKFYYDMSSPNKYHIMQQTAQEIESYALSIYVKLIEKAKSEGLIPNDGDTNFYSYILDNLFIMLQYSYTCGYHKERLKIFLGEDIFNNDELMIERIIKFIYDAFNINHLPQK
ncbi:TetR/AcrR family transcriptional regulator [Clostridium saccharoperbutylacetonicum]